MPNELEKSKINQFLADDVMREAVKKVLLSVTEVDLEKLASEHPKNEVLGEIVRGKAAGKEFINQGFDKLLDYQIRENSVKGKNPAL
jgi:hypothetical protein